MDRSRFEAALVVARHRCLPAAGAIAIRLPAARFGVVLEAIAHLFTAAAELDFVDPGADRGAGEGAELAVA